MWAQLCHDYMASYACWRQMMQGQLQRGSNAPPLWRSRVGAVEYQWTLLYGMQHGPAKDTFTHSARD